MPAVTRLLPVPFCPSETLVEGSMSSLIRIVYMSRSTFAPSTRSDAIDPNLARILSKSRKNNRDANVVGGLLFGDGCFLQCLEGESQVVDRLYDKIAADPRHVDVKLVLRTSIQQLAFSSWSMKYVPMENTLRSVLAAQGFNRFNPYAFTPANFDAMLAALQSQHDPSQHYAEGLLAPADASSPVANARSPAQTRPAKIAPEATSVKALRRANAALGIALVALAIAITAAIRLVR